MGNPRELALLAALACTGMSLLAALALFFSLKREIAKKHRQFSVRQSECATAIEQFSSRLEVAKPPQVTEMIPLMPVHPGMNLSRRSHILRLHRYGSGKQEIAATLGASLEEVELTLAIQRLMLQKYGGADGPSKILENSANGAI